MSNPYTKDYYHNGCGPIPYEQREYWTGFFGTIADKLIAQHHPKTVLDAGCAMGYLVEALRDRGVEAYGIDISEYALSQVRQDIQPYCFHGSITEPLPPAMPQRYDLLVTIEVLEHLPEEEGKKAIANLCRLSDTIVFTSSPNDFTEPTHINVQQREYWGKLFARQDFFNDLDAIPSYITAYAVCFRKHKDVISLVESYERNIRLQEAAQEAAVAQAKILPFQASLFWALGQEDYTPENRLVYQGDARDGLVSWDCTLPNPAQRLRFDPMECPCLLTQLSVYGDGIQLEVQPVNGNPCRQLLVFPGDDPQVELLTGGKAVSKIHLRAQAIAMEHPEANDLLIYLFGQIHRDSQALSQLNAELQAARDQVQKALTDCTDTVQSLQAQQEKALKDLQIQQENALKTLQSQHKEAINALNAQLEETDASLQHYQEHYHAAIAQREQLKEQLHQADTFNYALQHSIYWKLTAPLRFLVRCLKWPFRHIPLLRPVGKLLRCLRHHGLVQTMRLVKKKLTTKTLSQNPFLRPVLTESQRKAQENRVFSHNTLFSIVVPLYNTPPDFLEEMVSSVQKQTYGNWELCLADGSDHDHKHVEAACRKYAKADSRIHYKKLTENGGISRNTIAAYEMATGDYIVLLDHDDILTENALYECACVIEENPQADFIYSDRGVFDNGTKTIIADQFLPDYSPDFLRATNYASHLNLFSRQVIEKAGFIREGFDGSQDYDIELRVMEQARDVVHIPKILYYCRACEGSVALNPESKMYAYEAGRRAIAAHIARIGFPGEVEFIRDTFSYRIHYEIVNPGKVTIIIPNMDHLEQLKPCVESILEKTDYPDYEILIVENNSQNPETFAYYQELEANPRVRVITYQPETPGFNYSAINNFAVAQTDSPYVLFLNNDVTVINEGWLREMLMFAQRPDVGAVGARLYYPDDTYQHIGLFIGIGCHIATHYAHRTPKTNTGYMHRLSMPQNYNAVTAACMLLKRADFLAVGGFDQVDFKVGLNDVDLCLKLRSLGKFNVLTPYAELYHYESISRKSDAEGPNKARFAREQELFRKKWAAYFRDGACDGYYHPQLNL